MFGPKLVSVMILISGIPIRDFHKVAKTSNIVIKYKIQSIRNHDAVHTWSPVESKNARVKKGGKGKINPVLSH